MAILPYFMPKINLDDYTELDAAKDLEASLIEVKLRALVQGMPAFVKNELYP